MMFLARGVKCGALGRRGSADSDSGFDGAAGKSSLKSDASAIVPRPVIESLKSCRRVRSLRISSYRFIALTFGQCLIEIQEHVGHDDPGGELGLIFSPSRAAGNQGRGGGRVAAVL